LKVVRAGLFLLVLAALATVSMVATDFQLFRYTNIVIYALALIGMNLLVGYSILNAGQPTVFVRCPPG